MYQKSRYNYRSSQKPTSGISHLVVHMHTDGSMKKASRPSNNEVMTMQHGLQADLEWESASKHVGQLADISNGSLA